MKKFAFLLSALFLTTFAFSQPNFTGTWKLNSSKSKLGAEFSMAPKEIIVSQQGNELKLERHSSFQGQDFTINDKFTLDGKECINEGWQGSKKKSTAVWSNDKKSLKISTRFPMNDGGEVSVTEVYKMDGQT